MSTASASPAATTAAASPAAIGWRWAALEIGWIFLIFFLAAGTPPPDAGESHYLVKAKHYWEPAWCAGDLFLESRDAHLTFNWTVGWLTKFVSLDAATWTARVLAWLLLAWSWRRLSWTIVPVPLASLLTAGLMLTIARHCNLSRELVLRGGVEAKTFAYVFVLLALSSMARNQWRAALLLAGVGAAFHVLVGGWTVVAIAVAWVLAGHERPSAWSLMPAACGGFLLSLPGLIPALVLMAGVDPATAREACRTYVFERLSHHLVFHRFEPWYMARFAMLLAVGFAVFWRFRQHAPLWRLNLVVTGAVGISLIGIVLDQATVAWANLQGQSAAEYQATAGPLLRYYWFRLADVLVPASIALGLIYGLQRLHFSRPKLASYLLVGAMVVAGGDLALICFQRSVLRIPGAVIQQHPTADTRLPWWQLAGTLAVRTPPSADDGTRSVPTTFTAQEWLADWKSACRWIAANTPADAKILTPRQQQTFKWYAGRAEVATWKDIPQDARGLMTWRAAMAELHPASRSHRLNDLAAFSDAELVALAHKYGCQYIVIDRTQSNRPMALPRVYPALLDDEAAFAVYRVPPQEQR